MNKRIAALVLMMACLTTSISLDAVADSIDVIETETVQSISTSLDEKMSDTNEDAIVSSATIPEAEATATPEAEATATPEAEATATPEAEATATPEPEATATPEAEAAATPEPEVTATPEPEVTATPEPEATATPEPEVTATPTVKPVEIDTTRDASYSLSFEMGYAEILENDTEIEPEEAAAFLLSKGTVVYATERDTSDYLKVWVDSEEGKLSGWVAAQCIRPMSDIEVAEFTEEQNQKEDVSYLDATGAVPLQNVGKVKRVLAESEELSAEESEPVKLTLSVETLRIGVREKVQITSSEPCSFSSSQKKYATVSATGLVTGARVGTTVITARTADGREATCAVTVCPAPKKVTISAKKLTLGVGEIAQLSYAIPAKYAGSAQFISSNSAIVAVDAKTGKVTARKVGTAKIRVQTYNGKKAYCTVTVKEAPKSVQMNYTTLTIGVGQSLQLTATVNDKAAGQVAWASANSDVVSCAGGTVTGRTVGEAEVRATAYNGVMSTCKIKVVPKPTALTLSQTTLTIGVGEKVQLQPSAGEIVTGFSYASAKTKYAKVSATGLVTGTRAGTTTVSVTAYNGLKAECLIKVCSAPKKITLGVKSLTLGLGETAQLTYTLTKGSAGQVAFSSSDSKIVEVDAKTGKVTAKGIGKTKICAKTYNGKKAYVTVEVKNAPEQVKISRTALSIGVGETVNLSAALNSGAAGKITWSSADKQTATCSGGTVTGKKAGVVEISAAAYNGVTDKCTVTVVPAPKTVTLPQTTLTVGVGETLQLAPQTDTGAAGFTYKSSKAKYVKVTADGKIRGVRKGTATVTVRTYNGCEVSCIVKVCSAPKKITASATRLELGVGDVYKLGYQLPSNTASAVTFTSSNPKIANVNANTGAITALQTGSTTITLKTFNGRTATCTVNVYPAPDSMTLNAGAMNMGVGQNFQLKVTLPEGTRSQISYKSSDTGVAKVSASGMITAVGTGTAVLRVQTCNPDVYTDVQLTVWKAPTELILEETELAVELGKTYQLNPAIPEGSYSPIMYKIGDSSIAAINSQGKVTAKKRGSTTVTVSTYNGLEVQISLRVWDPLYPDEVKLSNQPEYLMLEDGEYTLEYSVEPVTATSQIQWVSSNTKVATIEQNGKIKLLNYGYSQIKAVSLADGTVLLEFTLTVQLENLSLVIPARVTQEDGIAANLAKIEKIRQSAIAQINALEEGGVITAADANKRRSIVNNIFMDYAFPWKTLKTQAYWKKANSDGGVKDFKPDRVYYGMPYTSGSSVCRQYNRVKAVSEGRFVDSGNGYYLLNQNKLISGKYVGNDCSALVNAAIWGVNNSHVYDRTSRIAVSSAYKTISNAKEMRPGDLLCRSGRHVVMFLYYANPEKTKIMIIENGGSEWGVNTVHCSVHNLDDYVNNSYKVRRLKTLG